MTARRLKETYSDATGISYLVREGTGRPVVLLHGIGSAAESFKPLVAHLGERPVLAWDMPGYGTSADIAEAWPTANDYARRLLALVDELGWNKVDLVGHSLGCVVAAGFASIAPGRLATLTLISPALGYGARAGAEMPPSVAKRITELRDLGPQKFAAARAANLVFQPEAHEGFVRDVRAVMSKVRLAGYSRAARLLGCSDVVSLASKIIAPTRVVVGAEDRVTPPANAERLFAALRDEHPKQHHLFNIVPAAGHAICLEKAAEVGRLILADDFPGTLPDGDDESDSSGTAYNVPPVTRAIKLLRNVAEKKSFANLSAAARSIGINRTTLLRLLNTLEAERFIEKTGVAGEYVLGAGLIEMVAERIFSIDAVSAATPVLRKLATDIGLSCHLGVLQDREVLYLLRQTPSLHLISNVSVGTRVPAHATTMGRILLGYRPWSEVEALYKGVALSAVTDKTATTLDALRQQITADRAYGLAWSESNFEYGINSYAAPVFDYSGQIQASINVSGPEGAFRGAGKQERIEAEIRRAAAEISQKLGYTASMGRKYAGEAS